MATFFPDFEAALVRYLTPALDAERLNIHIAATKLPDHPTQVIVRDDGGEVLPCGFLANARAGINIYATSDAQADHIGSHVTATLNGLCDGDPVVTANASRAYPVPDAEQPNRYLFVEAVIIGPTLT